MTKTRTPFFSFGSQGSVGESITSQKRGRDTVLRQLPVPTDPKTLPQTYQRWLYQHYAYLWTLQSPATKQAYATAGSRYHLTAFQYWMQVSLTDLTGLAAYYKMDDNVSPSSVDSSRNGLNLTVIGASPATGLIDGCFIFDGLNDKLVMPAGDLLNFRSDFTFELLVHCDPSGPNDMSFIWLDHTPPQRYIDLRLSNWRPAFTIFSEAGNNSCVDISGFTMDDDLWHHLAARLRYGIDLQIFVDGTSKRTIPHTIPSFDTDTTRNIGRHIWSWMKGHIDQCLLWQVALDDTLIARHSNWRYPPQ